MSEHIHLWQPIPLCCRQYECACGSTGYRSTAGAIREHHKKLKRVTQPTARAKTPHDQHRTAAHIADDWLGSDQE